MFQEGSFPLFKSLMDQKHQCLGNKMQVLTVSIRDFTRKNVYLSRVEVWRKTKAKCILIYIKGINIKMMKSKVIGYSYSHFVNM